MAVEPEMWLDGHFASVADIKAAALSTYGAITSFQVEEGGVRGLGLHLARLNNFALELFGQVIPETKLRDDIRAALNGRDGAWMRVSLFSPELTARNAGWTGQPRAMICVSAPARAIADGLRLKTVEHQRYAPNLKHFGQFDLIHARRQAILVGFDDALFVNHQGLITEGTLWNIGFTTPDAVIWPKGEILDGVTGQLIREGLRAQGIKSVVKDCEITALSGFKAAFICNSATPAASVSCIDQHDFEGSEMMMETIRSAWSAQPLQEI